MANVSVGSQPARSSPGRPRDPDRHEAVLQATRALLRENGYSALSIDAIARQADVSRRLIYRWWGHKARIVAEVLFSEPTADHSPNTGALEGDVRELINETVARYAKREMALGLPGLQADIVANPQLAEEVEQRYTRRHLERWNEVLMRAVGSGEIRQGQDHTAIAHAAVGAISVLAQERIFKRRKDITDFVTTFVVNAIR
jgi:AcrR family transcriptional regulator